MGAPRSRLRRAAALAEPAARGRGHGHRIVGVIGREIWYDERNMLMDDVDFALQAIEKWRVVWIDSRFGYAQSVVSGIAGGCQGFITAERDRKEREYIKKKWGKYYQMGTWRTAGVSSHLVVQRRSSNIITPDKI
jgi:hypothetical protein